jgi:hypothetical protein
MVISTASCWADPRCALLKAFVQVFRPDPTRDLNLPTQDLSVGTRTLGVATYPFVEDVQALSFLRHYLGPSLGLGTSRRYTRTGIIWSISLIFGQQFPASGSGSALNSSPPLERATRLPVRLYRCSVRQMSLTTVLNSTHFLGLDTVAVLVTLPAHREGPVKCLQVLASSYTT